MSEELRPCPFCGGKAFTSTFFDWEDLEYMAIEVNDSESIDAEVTCENERCINGWYLSPKAWNARPIEDALNARIAELEAEVTKGHELQDSYCDRIAELEGKIDQLTAHSDIERQDDKCSKPEPNVCEACGGDGTVLLRDGYGGQVIATAKSTYCNGTGRVNKERE